MEPPKIDLQQFPSPCFVIDRAKIRENLSVLQAVGKKCGMRVLFAQKAFSTFKCYDDISSALDGACASGLWEAKLAGSHFDGEIHTYSPAFRDDEIDEIFELSHTVVFNSVSQLNRFRNTIVKQPPGKQTGIRINPECSVTTTALYDPCAPSSRLGIRSGQMHEVDMNLVDGLHFHALCEQDSHALKKVLLAVEQNFAEALKRVRWLNMGGGHLITRPGYDTHHLIETIQDFRNRHPHLRLYMEPGAAAVLDAGLLISTVLDVIPGTPSHAILDVSCPCHTPDVLEMPYRPSVLQEHPLDTAAHQYRLGGVSCLAGDQFGVYGFTEPLSPGDRLAFLDMAQYSMVKTTFFNGVRHPAVAVYDSGTGSCEIVRTFTFEDYQNRL